MKGFDYNQDKDNFHRQGDGAMNRKKDGENSDVSSSDNNSSEGTDDDDEKNQSRWELEEEKKFKKLFRKLHWDLYCPEKPDLESKKGIDDDFAEQKRVEDEFIYN